MAVQAKKPISKEESRAPSGDAFRSPRYTTMPFVAPDVDIVLKPLIQSLQTSCPYPQSINQHLVFLLVFLAKVSEIFHPLQTIPIFRQFQPYRSVFLLVFLLSLGGFSLIKSPVFSPYFFIEFRRFFHQLNTHGFLLSFLLGLGGFFHLSNKAMTLKTYIRLLELASKKEGNCNLIKLCDQSCDRSNLIKTISDHY